MLIKLDMNDATLAEMFLETKALKDFLANPVFTDDRGFYDLSADVIREVYGEPVKSDFSNISEMCWFFTPKQNVLWKLLVDRGIIAKKTKKRIIPEQHDYKTWSKFHLS
jgi:hypothetical protein